MIKHQVYKYKFYLDGNHYIIFNDIQGEIHPHTWEITLEIELDNAQTLRFDTIEKVVNFLLNKYQNQLINDIKPFNTIIPTTENMAEYFNQIIKYSFAAHSWKLRTLEISESPRRTFVIKN